MACTTSNQAEQLEYELSLDALGGLDVELLGLGTRGKAKTRFARAVANSMKNERAKSKKATKMLRGVGDLLLAGRSGASMSTWDGESGWGTGALAVEGRGGVLVKVLGVQGSMWVAGA